MIIFRVFTLNYTSNDVVLTVNKFIINDSTFCFANTLNNQLFCSLCSNTSKISRGYFKFHNIINFICRIDNFCFF